VQDVIHDNGILPWQLFIDRTSHTIYWADLGSGSRAYSIMKANLDGSGIETITSLEHVPQILARVKKKIVPNSNKGSSSRRNSSSKSSRGGSSSRNSNRGRSSQAVPSRNRSGQSSQRGNMGKEEMERNQE
jgi:hypothetical protein